MNPARSNCNLFLKITSVGYYCFAAAVSFYGIKYISGSVNYFMDPKLNILLAVSTLSVGLLLSFFTFKNFQLNFSTHQQQHANWLSRAFSTFAILLGLAAFLPETLFGIDEFTAPFLLFIFFHAVLVFRKHFSVNLYLDRNFELLSLLFVPLFLANGVSAFSLSPIDKKYLKELVQISRLEPTATIATKSEKCLAIKLNFPKLKFEMKAEIDRKCMSAAMEVVIAKPEELPPAFNWAYAEYSKKPTQRNTTALACFYAEMNQLEYAKSIAAKNKMTKLQLELAKHNRCPSIFKRSVASGRDGK